MMATAALLVTALPAAAAAAADLPPLGGANATTIMAVGDSITFGCGYQAKPPDYGLECSGGDASYRGKLYELLTGAGRKVRFVGRARSGSGTGSAVKGWTASSLIWDASPLA
eukprot:COSAG03_NODE_11833_length_574_cov_1.002105_1_plen_112_part_00